MESENLIKNVLKNDNYEETIQKMLEAITSKESILQENIKANYNQIIHKCTLISELKIKNDISAITQRLNDFSFSTLVNHNKLKETEEMLTKLDRILHLSLTLQKILQKLEPKKENIESYFDIKFIQKTIKIFKQSNFYDLLKIQTNEKRKTLISKMNNKCCEWLNGNIELCRNIGEKIVNDIDSYKHRDFSCNVSDNLTPTKESVVDKKELNLTIILESLYIYKKLDIEETFYNFFNTKRENISNFLSFYELIGFLYIDRKLNEIDSNLAIREVNTNFDKYELIVLLRVSKAYKIPSKKIEAKLEKICVDYIFERQEYVSSKEDAERFFKDVSEYLKGVEQSCVFEIFYKCLDEMYMKYYEPNDIEKAIEEAKQYKNIEFSFKSMKIIQEKINNEKEKIDKIFEDEKYEELMNTYLCEEIILYIENKFIEKMKSTSNKRKIDGEVAKYYKYLQKHNEKYSDLFYKAVEDCKKMYK